MNTYELFLPLGLTATGFTSANAKKVAQTLAYLARSQKSGTTNAAMDIQPVGASNAQTAVKGLCFRFNTDFRLPPDLDDTSIDGGGIIIGTASNANGAKPRLTLTSNDDTKFIRMANWLKPYAMAGDMVAYLSTASLGEATDGSINILPASGGSIGAWLGQVNADSVDGVMPNAFSTANGFAFIGPDRRAARVGASEIIALPPARSSANMRR